MPKQNPYLIKENHKKVEIIQELKNKYKIPSFEEFVKTYEPNEEVEILTEAEYQDRLLHGSQYGPGNEQSTTAAVVAGAVVGGVAVVATGGLAAPVVVAGARAVEGAYHYHAQARSQLETRHFALLGLGVGALALGSGSRNSQNSSTSSSSNLERKTIWDWWGNGLAGWQRDYLLQMGYSDKGYSYPLYELKRVSKHCEKELLTEQSKVYIQQWINENDYSSSEERNRRERVINPPKNKSPVWKGMKYYRKDKYGKAVMTNDKTGSKKRYYQWDDKHNDIEVFDSNHKHLGSMDPRTGVMYKGPKGHEIKW